VRLLFALALVLPAAQDPEAEFRKPARKATLSVKNLSLQQAAETIFRSYDLPTRIDTIGEDTGIALLNLELRDAPFWEAVDRICAATGLRHNLIGVLGNQNPTLSFQNHGLMLAWDTLGDVRVFGRSTGGGRERKDFSIELWIAAPFWAVPKRAGFEKVTIDGRPLAEREAGAPWAVPKDGPPRKPGCITISASWHSAPTPAREARTVKVDGTLRVVVGEKELSLPFSLAEVDIHAAR
jgi:hypothetical protein